MNWTDKSTMFAVVEKEKFFLANPKIIHTIMTVSSLYTSTMRTRTIKIKLRCKTVFKESTEM
jgi:hypothetical protein